MLTNALASPPVALALCGALARGRYWAGGRLAPRGQDSPGKHAPYACGENLTHSEARISYRRFFRLALMFVVVHMGTLVIAMLPGGITGRLLATGYLAGVAVCVDILVAREGGQA